jgi:hypothetical protein
VRVQEGGWWSRALPEKYLKKGRILTFHVKSGGEIVVVYFDGEITEKSIWLCDVDVRNPFWALVNISGGVSTIIQIAGITKPHTLLNLPMINYI